MRWRPHRYLRVALVLAAVALCRPAQRASATIVTKTMLAGDGAYPSIGLASGEVDQFDFFLASTTRIRLETSNGVGGCPGDTRLTIKDALGKVIGFDDDAGVGECSRFVLTLSAGTYSALVTTFEQVGPYSLAYFSNGTCGNGILENESCDDGDSFDGDGCDSHCSEEIPILSGCGQRREPGFAPGDPNIVSLAPEASSRMQLRIRSDSGTCPRGALILVNDVSNFTNGGSISFTGRCPIATAQSLREGKLSAYIGDDRTAGAALGPYTLDYSSPECAICGNGIAESGERCDGKDLAFCASGPCTQSCTCPPVPTPCGDSIVAAPEECDDGNVANGDGCDSGCHREPRFMQACGRYLSAEVRALLDRYTFELDSPQAVGLHVQDVDGRCPFTAGVRMFDSGGGEVAGDPYRLEDCLHSLYALPAGRYEVRVSGFTTPYVFDYSNSECSECGNSIVEAELCDDGNTLAGDGCDAHCDTEPLTLSDCGSYADPGGPYVRSYSLDLPAADTVGVRVTQGESGCYSDVDLYVRDAQGNYVGSAGGFGRGSCPELVTGVLPAGHYTVEVHDLESWASEKFTNFAPGLGLEFSKGSCSACGNAIREAEACDDGNLISGDGCSTDCRVELPQLLGCTTYSSSGIDRGKSEEFELQLERAETVRIRTSDGQGGCPGDSSIQITDSPFSGEYSSDDDGGPGACSEVVIDLPPGTFGVRVRDTFASFGPYVLEYSNSDCSTCGNGIVEGEACDDGNRNDGDGCDLTCHLETPDLTACRDYTAPPIRSSESVDMPLTLDAPDLVRLETTSADGSCPGDTVLEVRDAEGQLLGEDDQNGLGNCSALTIALDAGVYQVSVHGYHFKSIPRPWVLRYQKASCAQCGDAVTTLGEECDDGDSEFGGGDACTSRCTLTPCGQPVNPDLAAPVASDALFALRAAVGITTCAIPVCDVNRDGLVSATDALLILATAVGARQPLECSQLRNAATRS